MVNEKIISIAVATYNGEKFLREQLDSILNQDYNALEIVCIDDKSTDSTPAILSEYQKQYPDKFKFYLNDKNIGSRKTFEKCVTLTSGDYIAFADQDDYWMTNKISTLYSEIIKDNNLAFVYSNSELVDDKLNTIQKKTWGQNSNIINGDKFYQILNENTIMGCSMLLRRDFALKCLPFPDKGFHHDWYLAIMALGMNYSVKYVDKVLFKYRRHSFNQVNKVRKHGSSNSTQFRALRTFNETASIDIKKFTNLAFAEIIEAKKELFRCILTKQLIKAFKNWHHLYSKLSILGMVNKKIKKSNFRYILYSLLWKKISV